MGHAFQLSPFFSHERKMILRCNLNYSIITMPSEIYRIIALDNMSDRPRHIKLRVISDFVLNCTLHPSVASCFTQSSRRLILGTSYHIYDSSFMPAMGCKWLSHGNYNVKSFKQKYISFFFICLYWWECFTCSFRNNFIHQSDNLFCTGLVIYCLVHSKENHLL